MDGNGCECIGEGSVRFGAEMIRLSSFGPLLADYVVDNGLENDESGMGRDLEEHGHGLIVLMSQNLPGGPEKMTEILGIASVSAEIPARLLPNASLCDIVPRSALSHSWRIEERSALCGDHVRLSVRQFVSATDVLSDYHDIRYRSYLQKII
jgi:hypothetical protein